jgi:predicted TPR repeat methyltransferase
LAEAGEIFQKALALAPEIPMVQFHIAVLSEKTGNARRALEITENLLANPVGLSQKEQEELRQINQRASHK